MEPPSQVSTALQGSTEVYPAFEAGQNANPHPSVGEIFQGKVVTLHESGAVIELPGYGHHGFVRASQISQQLDDASKYISEGEYVWAKVVDVKTDEFGTARIVLSMKLVEQETGKDLDSDNIQWTTESLKASHMEEESLSSGENVHSCHSTVNNHSEFRIGNSIPIDSSMLSDIEKQTVHIGRGIDRLLKETTEKLHEFSQLTLSSLEIYRLSVDELSQALCKATDHSLELITLCDELNHQFSTAQNLAAQIKTIKLVLDGLENVLR